MSFSGVVLTSAMTSLGLVLFCAYDLVIAPRDTPQSPFILDDLLIHLALVPGGLSLLGYLLGNPTYLSVHGDPRVGISPLEMAFMALYAVAAVVSNPRLFLWRFLAGEPDQPARLRRALRQPVRRASRRRPRLLLTRAPGGRGSSSSSCSPAS